MDHITLFYLLKPFIPRRLQLFIRRRFMKMEIKKNLKIWPEHPKSEKIPENWKGWLHGKKFAVVLTHDVEKRKGYDKCIKLMELEKELGFRSSFNFVPERYSVDPKLREHLVKEGFEVGVHGLIHDGKLFKNRKIFLSRKEKINYYLREWNAVGFRAPAMHHKLEWISELNILYDMSTFDTDPFEPQSDGVGTIFPFRVGDRNSANSFIELPYTLPQDHLLYIIMKERTGSIWKEKLDWIVKNGGMVLLNTHPDYMHFGNSKHEHEEYPSEFYSDFLKYIKDNYSGKFWNPLPKDLAAYWNNSLL